ncbi:MAG: hypothetical protein J2P27_01860 [Actinobacteria bacterium]|nr:hypothetical protein [Actinomycetota bacterium]
MKEIIRLLLLMAIVAYRKLPSAVRRPCPREGPSCSQLSLMAVRAGSGLADVRAIVAGCAPAIGKHEPTCDFGTGRD